MWMGYLKPKIIVVSCHVGPDSTWQRHGLAVTTLSQSTLNVCLVRQSRKSTANMDQS